MTWVHDSIFPLYPKGNERCVRCGLLFLETDVPYLVNRAEPVWQGAVHDRCSTRDDRPATTDDYVEDVTVQEGLL